jgi:nucleoside 2-deoxyribosyltransferase
MNHEPHRAVSTNSPTVYLAGPSGFTAPGLWWHNHVLLPKVTAAGLVPMDPWGNQSAIHDVLSTMEFGQERRDALKKANLEQGRYDLELVRNSRAIIAVLDGCDVDSGTALEIGYGFSLGLLIVGLRTDIRGSGDNEGSEVNLMIETCIQDSGGLYTTDLDEAVAFTASRLIL